MRESVGQYPAGFNPAIIHLVGAIATWWARSEGLIVQDLTWLRTTPGNQDIARKEAFPTQTRRAIKHWAKLLRMMYHDDKVTLDALSVLLQDGIDLLEDRNVILHSFWPYWQSNDQEVELSSVQPAHGDPSKIMFVRHKVSVDQLDDLNNKMSAFYHRVMAVSFNASQRSRSLHSKGDRGGRSNPQNRRLLLPS